MLRNFAYRVFKRNVILLHALPAGQAVAQLLYLEPAVIVAAALKQFQEASPAPKKDKAGPSHEER